MFAAAAAVLAAAALGCCFGGGGAGGAAGGAAGGGAGGGGGFGFAGLESSRNPSTSGYRPFLYVICSMYGIYLSKLSTFGIYIYIHMGIWVYVS